MGFDWRICKAAVEQEVLFPSPISFMHFLRRAQKRGELCEVLGTLTNPDGTVTALIRKRYNGNQLLRNADRAKIRKANELSREDLAIDWDIEVSADGKTITVYIESWFDVSRKFGIDTSDGDTWLNMYGEFNPYKDSLRVSCIICNDLEDYSFEYSPTAQEAELIKRLITEKIQEVCHLTPTEFCESVQNN